MIRDASLGATDLANNKSGSHDKIRGIRNLPTLSARNSLLNMVTASGDEDPERKVGPAVSAGSIDGEGHNLGFGSNGLFSTRSLASCCSSYGFTQPSSHSERTDENIDYESHSIESFFGRIDDLEELYKILCVRYAEAMESFEENGNCKIIPALIQPDNVRKVLFVGNPLPKLTGLNRFLRLKEAWIIDCNITEILKSDFEGLSLRKLFIYNNKIHKIDSFVLESLRVLWINGNNIKTLEFMSEGLPVLEELNVAQNLISSLQVKDFLKCPFLRMVNISGNPLSTLQDVLALKAIPSLRTLYFADPMYGKCPVAAHCDSRTMLLSILNSQVTCLDGKAISPKEIADVHEYVTTRGLYYYANSVRVLASQSMFRKTSLLSVTKKLSFLGSRLDILLDLNSRYRRIISNVQVVPIFTNAKNLMREQVAKIEQRIGKLTGLAGMSLRRVRTVMEISRWEQEAEKWIKFVEYQSHGSTQCHMLHSVHGPLVGNPNELCVTLHELIASLSCTGVWPMAVVPKLETIIVIRDIGMEHSLQKTYEKHFAPNLEPAFIPPEDDNPVLGPPSPSGGLPTVNYPNPAKDVTTYMDPDFTPPAPLHPYPDSIIGLPDKAQPVFLFLVCPTPFASNPLAYFQKVVNDKAIRCKGILLTNCLWHALRKQSVTFGIVIVVKVLKESVLLVRACRKDSADVGPKHRIDCAVFSVKLSQSLTPAYIITISFTHDMDKSDWKLGTVGHDGDVVGPARIALATLTDKIVRHGHLNHIRPGQNRKSQFIRKGSEAGFVADFASTLPYLTPDGDIERQPHLSEVETCHSSVQSISKFFGGEVGLTLTSVDLSGNKLGNLIGLEGLPNLKKLDLSNNKLMDINGLNKLPGLLELKLGWNSLRSLHATGHVLQTSTPLLSTLNILPNPFKDIREFDHAKVSLKLLLPSLNRVDYWIRHWKRSPEIPYFSPVIKETSFDQVAMKESWGSYYPYRELSGKCLTNLTSMPQTPPMAEGYAADGIELNLSDNYLTAAALGEAAFVNTLEWRTAIVKLELQENEIRSLDWMTDRVFPNLQMLNMANNFLMDVQLIPSSCPALRHLFLCGNPIACDGFILAPLKVLTSLITLDCTGCPVTSHPDYSSYVSRHLSSVKILDGIPMVKWQITSQVESTGGVVTQDWLEEKLGLSARDWSALKHLSLPNSNLQQISLSGSVLPHLMSLDLSCNRLSSFTSLSSLPGLKVLYMSHNRVSSLGSSTCNVCYSNTVQSQLAMAIKQKAALENPSNLSQSTLTNARKPKPIFPKLEVLILSHNDLSSLNDLHIHAMPKLQTLLCNCNNITSLSDFEGSGTIRAIVLDKNKIRDVPFNCLIGCKSLRYLHLEHNRLTALPRVPQLPNLTALHVGYNKIHSLTDMSSLARITDLSLAGNPATRSREDYRFRVAACLPFLETLDGKNLSGERQELQEFYVHSFPEAGKPHPNRPLLTQYVLDNRVRVATARRPRRKTKKKGTSQGVVKKGNKKR